MLARMWRAFDLGLRFLYVLLAPAILVLCATVFPITGTVVGAALATIVALLGSERWQSMVARIPLAGRVLGGVSRLGDFYAEHPPKPLIYYIVYPAVLPAVLFLRVPRREFLLYRKLNVISLVVILGSGAYEYLHHWRPELPLSLFITATITGFLLQLLATFALVMPIVTTVVALRQRDRKKTLWILITLAGAIATTAGISARHSNSMPIGRWTRIETRLNYAAAEYQRCVQRTPPAERRRCGEDNAGLATIVHALDAAVLALQNAPDDRAAALARAHEALAQLFKPDEASEFRLYTGEGNTVLFVRFGKQQRRWVGRDATHLIGKPEQLSPGARKVLGY